jgi:hypothetical protein
MISGTIRAVLAEYLAQTFATSAQEINAGLCADFATDVIQRLPGGLRDSTATDLCVASFMKVEGDSYESGRPFDRKLLRKHWPEVIPPNGLTWADLDVLSVDAGFDEGTHVWIEEDGLHYDAECPDGTRNFFELPFFHRVISGWIAEVQPNEAVRFGVAAGLKPTRSPSVSTDR